VVAVKRYSEGRVALAVACSVINVTPWRNIDRSHGGKFVKKFVAQFESKNIW
jgi:hypothetical protein